MVGAQVYDPPSRVAAGAKSSSWMLSGSRKTSTDAYGSSAIGDWVSGWSARSARDHAVGLEVVLPGLQVLSVGTAKPAWSSPVVVSEKCWRSLVVVAVQGDHELPVGTGEDLPHPARVRNVEHRVDVEDRPVPGDTGVQVGRR